MRRLFIAGGVTLASVLMLSGCATMSEDQCLVGDWGGKGYQDGLSGHAMSRLDSHAEACAKVGVTPNSNAYYSAREDGLRTYCRWENGFREGAKGAVYNGVCAPEDERRFLSAYEDGRVLHAAEQALSSAESDVTSARARIRDREEKLNAKERELRQQGLSNEDRDRIRARIREVRDEIRDAQRDLRRAEDTLDAVSYESGMTIRSIRSRYPGL